jgi:LysM repeat protein
MAPDSPHICYIGPQQMGQMLLGLLLTLALAALTACGGEVVTTQPTAKTPPTRTPAPTIESLPGPTATAPLLPPAPTATPTATPTPIIHVVEEGDTLGAIAFRYEVSVDGIQAANGIDNPQFLQIGQELIIPTDDDEAGPIPGLLLPTATPLPLIIQGVAFYETPVGSLWCLGEVVNTTDLILANTQVHVALFDASGGPLVQASAFAAAEAIPPGERSPFGILFTSPPPDWASSQVTIMRGEAAGPLAASYVSMAVTETEGQPSGPQFQVSGIVQNISTDQAASSVDVIVTAYDAEGMVTAFRQVSVEVAGALVPGSTVPFTIRLNSHGALPADFGVIAIGRTPSE